MISCKRKSVSFLLYCFCVVHTVIPMMNLVVDQALHRALVPVLAPVQAAVPIQAAVTQEVAQTVAANQILTRENPRRRLKHPSQTLMEQM